MSKRRVPFESKPRLVQKPRWSDEDQSVKPDKQVVES